jgi:hypothetical protein
MNVEKEQKILLVQIMNPKLESPTAIKSTIIIKPTYNGFKTSYGKMDINLRSQDFSREDLVFMKTIK